MSKHIAKSDPTEGMTEAEMAEYYYTTRDLSGFEGGEEVPVTIRRNVTISVRFNEDEIKALRAEAERRGQKVTAFIRDAALAAAAERPMLLPTDLAMAGQAAADVEAAAHNLAVLLGTAKRTRA